MSYSFAKKIRTFLEEKIHAEEPSPVLPPAKFPWHRKVEILAPAIRQEFEALLPRLQEVVNFNDVLPNQRALKQGTAWKSFFLIALGDSVKEHQKMCPTTTEALTKIPGVINAFFSVLAPGTEIPAHRGPYAGIMRYHLGLIIPKGDVAIRVGEEICQWEEGKSLFFDDSFDHEAWNRTNEWRAILFVDFERPLPLRLSLLNRIVLWFFRCSDAAKAAHHEVMTSQLRT